MKTGLIAVVAGVAVAGAALWFGRNAWAAHHGLVTLQVKNAPLAEVVRQIEDQIHQKIGVDQKLDAKVTLDVKRMPLTNVLDSLADQTGGRWGTTYAVYGAPGALGKLEEVFAGASTLDAAGWTNIAPQYKKTELPPMSGMNGGGPGIVIKGPDGQNATFQSPEEMQKFMNDKMKNGASFATTEDVSVTPTEGGGKIITRGNKGPGDGPMMGKRVMVRVNRGSGGTTTTTTTTDADGEHVTVVKASPEGVILQEDKWSKEQMVIETPLMDALGDAIPEKANRETAAQTATKVRGKYVTYYALEKPPLGGDFRALPGSGMKFSKSGTNNPMAEMEAERKANMMGGLGKLTPEQQVQRARQMQEAKDASK